MSSELSYVWLALILVLAVLRGVLYVKQEQARAADRRAKAAARAEREAARAERAARPRKVRNAPATASAAAQLVSAAPGAGAPTNASGAGAPAAVSAPTPLAAPDELPVWEEPTPAELAPPAATRGQFTAPPPPSRDDFIAAGKIIPAGTWDGNF